MPVTFTIPWAPMTANKRLRSHWATVRKEKKATEAFIAGLLGRGPWCYGGPIKNPKPMQVSVTVYRQRLQDSDNLVASTKSLWDSLKSTGWIYDDAPEWVNATIRECKCKRGEERTHVELKELEKTT